MCFRKRAVTKTFLCLNCFTCFNVLRKSVLPSFVELKPFECFMWSYLIKLEMLLLCVQSGWNRTLIALVHFRKWKIEVDSYVKFKEFNCSFWHLWLIWICRIQCHAHFFCFRPEILFLSKFCPKNQNCHFWLTFRT